MFLFHIYSPKSKTSFIDSQVYYEFNLMNKTNLPEPTYRFNKLFKSYDNTKRLLVSLLFLTKKVLML